MSTTPLMNFADDDDTMSISSNTNDMNNTPQQSFDNIIQHNNSNTTPMMPGNTTPILHHTQSMKRPTQSFKKKRGYKGYNKINYTNNNTATTTQSHHKLQNKRYIPPVEIIYDESDLSVPLPLGYKCYAVYPTNKKWYEIKILEKKLIKSNNIHNDDNDMYLIDAPELDADNGGDELNDVYTSHRYIYYIHYIEWDRRMDEWIPRNRIRLTSQIQPVLQRQRQDELAQLQRSESKAELNSNNNDKIELDDNDKDNNNEMKDSNDISTDKVHDGNDIVGAGGGNSAAAGGGGHGHGHFSEEDLRAHEECTKVKNIDTLVFGIYRIQAWYYSPFPTEYNRYKTLYFCEFCLSYYGLESELIRHSAKCSIRHPPGNEIYRSQEKNVCVSVFELDGQIEKTYCIDGSSIITLASGLGARIDSMSNNYQLNNLSYSDHIDDGGFVVDNITAHMNQGVKQCVELVLEDGRRIVCTPDHQLYTMRGYVRADELRLGDGGDRIICGLEGVIDDPSLDKSDFAFHLPNLDRTYTLSQHRNHVLALSRLVGHIITNGAVHHKTHCVTFHLDHQVDVDAVEADLRLFIDHFNTFVVDKSASGGSSLYYIGINAKLSCDLVSIGNICAGKRAHTRRLPFFITDDNTPLCVVRECIASMFGVDGSPPIPQYPNDGWTPINFMCTGADRQLITQLTSILNDRFSIQCRNMSVRKTQNDSITYQLSVKSEYTLQFHEQIGFRYCVHKQLRMVVAATWYRASITRTQQSCRIHELAVQHHTSTQCNWAQARDWAIQQFMFTDIPLSDSVFPSSETIANAFRNSNDVSNWSTAHTVCTVRKWLDVIGAADLFATGGKNQKRVYSVTRTRSSIPSYTLGVHGRRDVGDRQVFDVTVDNNHNFLANGAVVHNCQALCYIGKLYLDHKTLEYDCTPFLFYVICELDELGYHPVGYFSKEKHSSSNYNLACILTLPCHQRKGYGKFIISLSYELSKIEERVGSPEKPVSDLGQQAYSSYWSVVLVYELANNRKLGQSFSIEQLSIKTCITCDDIIETLKLLKILQWYQGRWVYSDTQVQKLEQDRIRREDKLQKLLAADPHAMYVAPCRAERLHWTPYVVPTNKNKSFTQMF